MTTKSSSKSENTGYISRRSRRGIYVFVLCCLALVYTPRVLLLMSSNEDALLTTEEINYFHQIHKTTSEKKSQKKNKSSKFKVPPEKFDPSVYSASEWMYLGLSEKQTKVVMKFAARGIKNEDQLKQIFVIPDQLFYLIKDSVIFSITPHFNERKVTQSARKEISMIELNTASADELEKLVGIGPYLSDKIVSLRSQLGGFNQIEQLLEVYKFPPELLESIKNFVTVDPLMVHKINVNSGTTEELNAHPYLNWNQANSIVKIRKQKGKYTSLDQLKESVLIDEKTYKKILPYVTL